MSKKSVIAAIALISIGIVFGILVTSSFSGGGVSFGTGKDHVTIGSQDSVAKAILNLRNTSDAFVAIAKEVTPTVVYITVTSRPRSQSDREDLFPFRILPPDVPQQGSGSGVIITSDGYILTNNHVVENAHEKGITVVTNDRKEFKAKVVGVDKNTDLAVIKVEGKDFPVARLGNSDEVKVGQFVLAVGNPLGLTSTVTHGIVSALGRSIGILAAEYRIEDFIQTDAAINPGNSGGALVDMNGAVIGISSAIATTNGLNQGYGFAIPINLAKKVAEDIVKYGKVARAVLGVRMEGKPMDETTAKSLGLDKVAGVLVQAVTSGSAADEAGIKEGDIILAVDGREVNSPSELQEFIGRKHPGDEVTIRVFRDGKTFERKAVLKALAEEKTASQEESGESSAKKGREATASVTFDELGFAVQDIDSRVAKEYGVEGGVVIKDVKVPGLAYDRGLRESDVITGVSKKGKKTTIGSVKDLEVFFKGCSSGEYVLVEVKSKTGDAVVSHFVAIQVSK